MAQQQRQVVLSAGQIRVSSVLNKDAKQFGKQNMIDATEETCWNSDQGSPQSVQIRFDCPTRLDLLKLMFQGGFAPKELKVVLKSESDTTSELLFYPLDNNSFQSFPISNDKNVTQLQLIFPTSTDFFGRITIYRLELWQDL
eukprot:TRINITY_DN7849_c0_g1_i1.p1 TRINITY_DN7849_c0_g1~~TRINITY_DN7849_c0_g1_i1.p1  ORF type:complete len:150 (+),score=29.48 TRINITY_DN7849_c0_g1_i1:27-452(+)